MKEIENGLREISEIRSMMERASKFLSLSGLSGVGAGIVALSGAWTARGIIEGGGEGARVSLVVLACATLVLAVAVAMFFSHRMARTRGLPFWDPTARRVVLALAVPLGTGGAFCGVLFSLSLYELLPAAMLVFYGLALVQASSFTLRDVRFLGYAEILLGLAAGMLAEWGLILWGVGFGLLHILYGTVMYFRYERETPT